jgi:beta-lactamase regulating signal transducer with metallopeptidase domain
MIELSLPNAITYSIQILLIVLAAATAARLLPLPTAMTRFAYWRAIMTGALLLPLLSLFRAVPVVTTAIDDGVSAASSAIAGPQAAGVAPQLPWVGILAGVVGFGIFARTMWLLFGLARLHRLRAESAPLLVDDEIEALRRGLAHRARLRSHAAVEQPIAFGFRRPIILLPDAFEKLSPETQRAVACHELLHIHRHDWLWMLGEEVIRTVFWFHPAMRWAISQVQLGREELVYARAVELTGARRAYMDALIHFAGRPALAPATVFARRNHLAARIRHIAQEVHMSRARLVSTVAVLVGALTASTWVVTHTMPLRAEKAEAGDPGSPLAAQAIGASLSPARPPKVIGQVQPSYPADPFRAGLGARVTLIVTVNRDGRVTDVRDPDWSLEVTGRSALDDMSGLWRRKPWLAFVEAAESALRQWTFEATREEIVFPVTAVFRAGQPGVAMFIPAPPPPPPPPPDLRVAEKLAQARQLLEQLKTAQQGTVSGQGFISPVPGSSNPGQVPVAAAPPPPPPPPPPPSSAGPLVVGGPIKPPSKTFDVRPVYPAAAQASGVEGVVVLRIRIGTDGSVVDASVML